ncbi:myotubularin-related protein 11 isoform X1 [Nerophis lumbriciformis]|uniref:myotubularin-related protein 11 isoform X1 n=1 Tax=Nerophis lumbriciformis TaxID=546530 RepID=UPI002ADF1DD0|nr:myotubularin-related protein 11 isoform X1 [Nerophis lumbriciformis]
MLTGSKSTFKVRQMLPDIKERMLSQSGTNARSRDVFGLRCLPGECVLQRVAMVRKKLTAREGRGWLSGTLFCTHFRVAFVPQDAPKPDDNAEPVLLGDHDVALASIEKVVVVGPNRTKLVTPNSSLKFTPEELVLYCRDLRVVCFLFDRLTPDPQVIEMTHTIAKTYQPLKPGSVLSFQNAALGSVEMKQFLSNRRRDAHMNWYESTSDLEQEVERCGASGWRVSSVNERFEMSTSLPRFIVVPQKVLDTELKKSFAHFNDGRIPRWCWRHPRGSDLLRMSSFQNNIYHEKDDIRNLELILFGSHSSLCVVVELGEELPSPADVQLAHGRLRSLCLGDISTSVTVPDDKWLSTLEGTHWLDYTRACLKKASEVACLLRSGHMTVVLQEADDRDMGCVVSSLVQVMCDPHCRSRLGFQSLVQKEWVTAGHRFYSRINYHRDNDKEEAPVFLLFLDCVWQLWSQYPSRFQLTDDFLLALHDSTHLPLFSSFLGNCQRERCRRSQNLGQTYTPVNGWRDASEPPDPPLPSVWDWSLQCSKQRQARFTQPVSATPPLQPLLNGNLNSDPDANRLTDAIPGSVFLLSRGIFSCPANLLPWRSGGTSGVYRKSHRRAPSSENVPGLERLMKAWSLTEVPAAHAFNSGLHGPVDPYQPLIPLLMGPCVGLWRECYHRGALHAQVRQEAFSHPTPADSAHPLERLCQEVQQLRDKLAEAASDSQPDSLARKTAAEPRRDANSNQTTDNNATFLFAASGPPRGGGVAKGATAPPTSLNHNSGRAPRPSSAASRGVNANRHTFLFGHAPAAQTRPNAKADKSGDASVDS